MTMLVDTIPATELVDLSIDQAMFARNDEYYQRTAPRQRQIDDLQLEMMRNQIVVPRGTLQHCAVTPFMSVDGYMTQAGVHTAFAHIAWHVKNVAEFTTAAHEQNSYAVQGFDKFGTTSGNKQRRDLIAVARAVELTYGWPGADEPEEPFWRIVALAYALLFGYKLYRSQTLANRFHTCYKDVYTTRRYGEQFHLEKITTEAIACGDSGELAVAILFPGQPLAEFSVAEFIRWLWRAEPPNTHYPDPEGKCCGMPRVRAYRLFCEKFAGVRLARAYDDADIPVEELMDAAIQSGIHIAAAGHLLNCVRMGILPTTI